MNALCMKYENRKKYLPQGTEVFLDYANSRLKVLKYNQLSVNMIMNAVSLARTEKFGKVLVNCRLKDLKYFKEAGFVIEGMINGFFKGEDAYCMSLFLDKEREQSKNKEKEDEILELCFEKERILVPPDLNCEYKIRNSIENDIPQMVKLFKTVFKTYPSPIFDQDYLKKIMNKKVLFKVALKDNMIVSIASADMDKENLNAEITDCATYPEYRGQGLLSNLAYMLEKELVERKFNTLYSLSRAINAGINISLGKLGYDYGGRLVNNCDICGGFEDMNIWVKKIKG